MSNNIPLPARMDYAALDGLHAEIKEARGEDVSLDASKVTHLGACGLQLLISARKTWDRDGHTLSVTSATDRFHDHIQLLGYEGKFFEKSEAKA